MENGVRKDHFSRCPEGERGMVRAETEVCRSWTVLANSPKPFSCMVVKIKTRILEILVRRVFRLNVSIRIRAIHRQRIGMAN